MILIYDKIQKVFAGVQGNWISDIRRVLDESEDDQMTTLRFKDRTKDHDLRLSLNLKFKLANTFDQHLLERSSDPKLKQKKNWNFVTIAVYKIVELNQIVIENWRVNPKCRDSFRTELKWMENCLTECMNCNQCDAISALKIWNEMSQVSIERRIEYKLYDGEIFLRGNVFVY